MTYQTNKKTLHSTRIFLRLVTAENAQACLLFCDLTGTEASKIFIFIYLFLSIVLTLPVNSSQGEKGDINKTMANLREFRLYLII